MVQSAMVEIKATAPELLELGGKTFHQYPEERLNARHKNDDDNLAMQPKLTDWDTTED
jgi:hypothetical protein